MRSASLVCYIQCLYESRAREHSSHSKARSKVARLQAIGFNQSVASAGQNRRRRSLSTLASMEDTAAAQSKLPEEPQGMEEEARLLTQFSEVPSVTAAWITEAESGKSATITVQSSQRDLPGNKQRKSLITYHAQSDGRGGWNIEQPATAPVELVDVQIYSPSPSGKRTLIVRGGKDSDSSVLEIWGGGRLLKEVCVPKQLHGPVYNDGWFANGAEWHPTEEHIAYVAEAPAKVQTPHWGSRELNSLPSTNGKTPSAGPKGWRGQGEWEEDWGELNTGKRTPQLYVLDIAASSVSAVDGLPEDSSVGQPIWTPDGSGLVFVAWKHKSLNFPNLTQRLGIVYCVNRPCSLYHVPFSVSGDIAEAEEAKCLTSDRLSAISPRFSPDGKILAFLSHESAALTGVHGSTASLHTIAWPAQGPSKTEVHVVSRPASSTEFPGLYSLGLSRQPFAGNRQMLITSQWRSTTKILDVALGDDGGPAVVHACATGDHDDAAWSLLAVGRGLAVGIFSSPKELPRLAVAGTGTSPLQWQALPLDPDVVETIPQPVTALVQPHREAFKVLQVSPTTEPHDIGFEAVLLLNEKGEHNAPTVLTPHGGPHSAFPAAYYLSNAYFNALGYNVLQVNFRGSLGFGEDSIQSLPGRVGTNDVTDCIAALDASIEQGFVDKDRVAVIGGSHGGLLTSHLLGQYPDRFKCGVLRNPVLDIALMSQISDIPDWCFIEGFGSKEGLKRASVKPSLDELRHLTEMSPIAHVDRVKAPMFMMLGAKDRRVVYRDAQQYTSAMKARSGAPEIRTIVFPEDTHGLDRVQTEFEQWLNAAWWLKRFL